MKKYNRGFFIILFIVCVCTGCENYQQMLEEHKAIKMQQDGVWEERYKSVGVNDAIDETEVILSINVKKDMSVEDMLAVLEYHELFYNAELEGDIYTKEKESDYSSYAVFYRGDTDEAIKRFKYCNRESVPINKEDEVKFASPDWRTEKIIG